MSLSSCWRAGGTPHPAHLAPPLIRLVPRLVRCRGNSPQGPPAGRPLTRSEIPEPERSAARRAGLPEREDRGISEVCSPVPFRACKSPRLRCALDDRSEWVPRKPPRAESPRDRGASTRSVGRPHALEATPPADTWGCVVSGTSCGQVCRVTDPPLAGQGLNGVPRPRVIGIFLGSVRGSSGTGMRTSRTPSLYDAWTSSWCTPAGSVTVREKVP